MSNIFNRLIGQNRLLRFQHNSVLKIECCNLDLIEIIVNFIDAYCDYEGIDDEYFLKVHNRFNQIYSKDILAFKETGRYPFELNDSEYFSRIDYDLVLMLSVLLSPVRYNILNNLYQTFSEVEEEISVIGIGSGMDIEVINRSNKKKSKIIGYDTKVSEFTKQYFLDDVIIIEDIFSKNDYPIKNVVALELLEHLENPHDLIKDVAEALPNNGNFFFTTATDMPQFDHLFNFKSNDIINGILTECRLKKIKMIDYHHHYIGGPATSKNTWYETRKYS
jgi:hypothetical protein